MGPEGTGMVNLYEDYHRLGIEALVITSDTGGDDPELFFAGVPFYWGRDALRWGYEWGNGVTTNGWLIFDTKYMGVRNIGVGWDNDMVRSQLDEMLADLAAEEGEE